MILICINMHHDNKMHNNRNMHNDLHHKDNKNEYPPICIITIIYITKIFFRNNIHHDSAK